MVAGVFHIRVIGIISSFILTFDLFIRIPGKTVSLADIFFFFLLHDQRGPKMSQASIFLSVYIREIEDGRSIL